MKLKFRLLPTAVMLLATWPAAAEVIYSNALNTNIPLDFNGVTVNVGSGSLNAFFGGVDIGGDFAMGGALLFDIGTVFTEDATFLLFDVAGSRSGDFSSVGLSGDMGSGSFSFNSGTWSLSQGVNQWSFVQNTGTLSLTVIPEPSVALLSGIGLLALLHRRRI